MDMKNTIYLIRHGETDWNREKRVQGSIDIPLNQRGQDQASKLFRWFQNRHIDAIYSSDLARAYDTARSLATHYNLAVRTFSELRERSYGLIEGKEIQQFQLTHSDEFGDWKELEQYQIEPLVAVKNRAFQKIEELVRLHHRESIAIVSHGGTINAFLSLITEGESGSGKIKIDNTAVTEIEYNNGTYRILTLNDTSHLLDGEQNLVV